MKRMCLTVVFFAILANHALGQTFSWAKAIIGAGNNEAYGVAHDNAGNVYTTGYYMGITDFDPGAGIHNLTGTYTADDRYIEKLDTAGHFVWVKTIAYLTSTSSAVFSHVYIGKDNSILIGGSFAGTVDFDPGPDTFSVTSVGPRTNGFILKLDTAGSLVWVKQITSNFGASVTSITTDDSNNILSVGSFYDTADFDPGVGVYNLYATGFENSCFVLKLNDSGNFVWAKNFDADQLIGNAICADHNNSVYVGGEFYNNADLDPGTGVFNASTPSTFLDAFVTKLDAAGNFLWAKQIGDTQRHEAVNSLRADAGNNVCIAGNFASDSVDFDRGGAGHYLNRISTYGDPFIAKYDAGGHLVFAEHFGDSVAGSGSSGDGYGVSIDTFGSIYLVGDYTGTVDFDPGPGMFHLSSIGAHSAAYISKFDSLGRFQWAGSIGSRGTDNIAFAVDLNNTNGNIYIGGVFQDTTDFDPGAGSYFMYSRPLSSFIEQFNQCLPFTPGATIVAHPGTLLNPGQTDTFSATASFSGATPGYQWYINGAAVTGATSSMYMTHTLASNDTIKCMVTSSDTCAAVATCASNPIVVYIREAVAEVNLLQQVKLYPNPNAGAFWVSEIGIASGGSVAFAITNVLGQQIHSGTLAVQGGNIKKWVQLGSDIPAGIYFLHIFSETGNKVTRFCVER